MNYELQIAKRIAFSQDKDRIASRPIIRIAIIGMALGFSVMIIAISIVTGFKKEIREKVIGFGSHIQISNYDENNSFETQPVELGSKFVNTIRNMPGVKHVQVFAMKAGIIKAKDEIEGVVAKGIGRDFNWDFFRTRLLEGNVFSLQDGIRSDSILISANLARKLNLHAGNSLIMHFIQKPPRARKFYVAGVYQTGLEEFDNLYMFCDISQIQKLNDWGPHQVGGYEITVTDFNNLDEISEAIYSESSFDLKTRTIKNIYPQVFDWLNLQNINAIIIITLMIIVCGMNMISALLIIILERINMIGMLKALGATGISIRKVFIYLAGYLIGKGMLWGNVIGLGFIILQSKLKIFHLDQKSYYLSFVPVDLSLVNFSILNIGTLLVCTSMMVLPTILISKINPLSAIRYS